MGFRDYPFLPRSDPRRFPGHGEVLVYLQEFASEFGVEEVVRFETEVVSVEMADNDDVGKWRVKSKTKREGLDELLFEEVFDAVVVCNGHHTEPRIAEMPGIDLWPGKQIHSHNYRALSSSGINSYSATDLSIEVAGVAKEVHVASRSVADDTCKKRPGFDNMWLHSMIESAHEDGTIISEMVVLLL